jgi:hypothetical protein
MLVFLSHRNNDYYRPDRFPHKVKGFEGAALTRDGTVANPGAANELAAKIAKERAQRIKEQGHA